MVCAFWVKKLRESSILRDGNSSHDIHVFFHFIIISFPDAVHMIQDPLLFPLEILCLPLYFGLAGITNPQTVVQYSVTAS